MKIPLNAGGTGHPNRSNIMQVTLANSYHGTSATVRPVAITEGRFAGMHKISRKTALRLRTKLCGSSDCTCGGTFGERGGASV